MGGGDDSENGLVMKRKRKLGLHGQRGDQQLITKQQVNWRERKKPLHHM